MNIAITFRYQEEGDAALDQPHLSKKLLNLLLRIPCQFIGIFIIDSACMSCKVFGELPSYKGEIQLCPEIGNHVSSSKREENILHNIPTSWY